MSPNYPRMISKEVAIQRMRDGSGRFMYRGELQDGFHNSITIGAWAPNEAEAISALHLSVIQKVNLLQEKCGDLARLAEALEV